MLEMDELDIKARAVGAPAFSNGFEWDNWSAGWCGTCRHDEQTCPLVGVALVDQVTPAEWREVSLGGLANRYECEKYEPRDGEDDARAGLPREGHTAECKKRTDGLCECGAYMGEN